jgi:hypothetical protein
MSESDLKMLKAHFERLRRECNTREKAIAQLQSEGLVDENGQTAALYRDSAEEALWQ